MDNYLIEELIKIENKYLPIIQILENNSKYKDLYRGFITFQSKISPSPDILFLGINPGEGAFRELNPKRVFNPEFPKRKIDPENLHSLNLDWSKKGNARGESIEKKWHSYEWFEDTKKINNSFPARMMELLYSYTEKANQDKKHQRREIISIIENDLQDKIVYTNISPIATKSVTELAKIYNLLSKEKNISELIGITSKVTPALVKNFFRQRMIDIIKILDPKIIVLLGHTTYHELTQLNDFRDCKVIKSEIKLRKNDLTKYKIISFSRQGNWSPLINEIATSIAEYS